MPQNTVTCAAGTWTLLTDADMTVARLQNQGGGVVHIQALNGTGSPDLPGSIMLKQSQGVQTLTLADDFRGVTSANRLYAYALNGTQVSISHD